MSNIPAVINIGNIAYNVRLQKPDIIMDHIKAADRDDVDILGRIKYKESLIELNETLEGSRLQEVLTHEIVHGLLYESGLDHLNDEQNVDILTHVIRRFIKENDIEWMR